MSNIPLARILIQEIMVDYALHPDCKKKLRRVLRLMKRVPYCRRAPAKRRVIDKHLRRRVKLLLDNTDMTMHEIANRTGLRSGGRISEVAHGKR
jgi:hypothetical protein